MKTPTLETMRGVLSALVKEVIDVTPHVDKRPDIRKCKANVLVLHGLREHVDTKKFSDIFKELTKAGYHAVGFDFPNHGINCNDEKKRGVVEDFRRDWIEIARGFAFWLLLSKKWGDRPTFIIGRSLGALTTMRLLQLKFVLRKGIQGSIYAGIPLKVDQNASETARRWIPFIKPFRGVAKRAVPNLKISDARVDADDPLHANGPTTLRTAVEIFDATDETNAIGQIERLRETNYVAFFHGSADTVAPIKNAYEGFHRIAGPKIEEYQKSRREGIKQLSSPDGKRLFVQYDNVSHDLFEESPHVIPDIIATLDKWCETARPHDMFVDHRQLPLEDIINFVWLMVAHVAKTLWETKHRLWYIIRNIRRILNGDEMPKP